MKTYLVIILIYLLIMPTILMIVQNNFDDQVDIVADSIDTLDIS
jgi:hypothetical protein